jgi:hypothetical protein
MRPLRVSIAGEAADAAAVGACRAGAAGRGRAGLGRVLGVDDWSQKRGRTYGTILVNLETQQVIDLLPDRTAETLATWLQQHPDVWLQQHPDVWLQQHPDVWLQQHPDVEIRSSAATAVVPTPMGHGRGRHRLCR